MKNFFKYLAILSVFGIIFFIFANFCSADALLEKIGQQSGAPKTDFVTLVSNIIKIILGLLGVIFLVLVIQAGVKWMISKSENDLKEAKSILMNAVIGLVIIVSAWSITNFVTKALKNIETGESGTSADKKNINWD